MPCTIATLTPGRKLHSTSDTLKSAALCRTVFSLRGSTLGLVILPPLRHALLQPFCTRQKSYTLPGATYNLPSSPRVASPAVQPVLACRPILLSCIASPTDCPVLACRPGHLSPTGRFVKLQSVFHMLMQSPRIPVQLEISCADTNLLQPTYTVRPLL